MAAGWIYSIYTEIDPAYRKAFGTANWQAALDAGCIKTDISWEGTTFTINPLEALVASGVAEQVADNIGFPNIYAVPRTALVEAYEKWLSDEAHASAWITNGIASVRDLEAPNLIVEVWDRD